MLQECLPRRGFHGKRGRGTSISAAEAQDTCTKSAFMRAPGYADMPKHRKLREGQERQAFDGYALIHRLQDSTTRCTYCFRLAIFGTWRNRGRRKFLESVPRQIARWKRCSGR